MENDRLGGRALKHIVFDKDQIAAKVGSCGAVTLSRRFGRASPEAGRPDPPIKCDQLVRAGCRHQERENDQDDDRDRRHDQKAQPFVFYGKNQDGRNDQ